MIITVANQKGGVGKSTIAANLAVCYALQGRKATLIDTDEQASSITFRASRPEERIPFQAFQITKPTIHKDVIAKGKDVAIIDAGGRDNKVYRSAIFAADLLLIPINLSPFDIWSSEDTFRLYEEFAATKDFKALVLLNMLPTLGNRISFEARELLDELAKKYNFKVMKSALYHRVAYKESVTQGLGVVECADDPRYQKASIEFLEFFKELNKEVGK